LPAGRGAPSQLGAWVGFASEAGCVCLEADVEEVSRAKREYVAVSVDEGILDADFAEEVLGLGDTDFDDFAGLVLGFEDLGGAGGHELPGFPVGVGNQEFSFGKSALLAGDEVVELAG
jgi:hypothetical protein